MGIFGRGRKKDVVDAEGSSEVTDPEAGATEAGVAEAGHATDAAPDPELELGADDAVDEDESFSRARGPFDASEVADDDVERLDLGSIRFVPVDGMQLRLELDESQQIVLGAHALVEGSGVQLQVFAAPRTSGIWPDIRTEIAESIVSQGGTADVVRGPLGRELVTRMPQRGPDGRTVFSSVRFIGVDGPRWFLRAVLNGAAAGDDAAAAPLLDLVRSVVVVRGDDAMPPREILPLRLPAEINPDSPAADADPSQDGEGAEAADATDAAEGAGPRVDDLKPFERGPEITEVR